MTTYRARWVLPITSPPIAGGWLEVDSRGTVIGMGDAKPPSNAIDLGDTAILPALVNAHTHLEFSDLAGPLGHRGISLADWIELAIQSRLHRDEKVVGETIAHGIAMSRSVGVGLIADIATPPNVFAGTVNATQVVAFPEVIGLSPERSAQRFTAARDLQADGISPHAPYSLGRGDIDRVVDLAITENRNVAMHLAESPDERELCFGASGPFARTLRRIGAWREDVFPWQTETDWCGVVGTLSRAPRSLIVHGNDLTEKELRCISAHRQLTIVYCPRTHDYFGHPRHPIERAWGLGIRVALGTDSLASNPDLSIWSEVQFLFKERPDLNALKILAAATMDGADAIGCPSRGRIEVGSRPGLIQVPTSADDVVQLCKGFADSVQPQLIG